MSRYNTYRMPIWFPCFLSTLVAFASGIKPAMTLSTLPAESGLYGLPPWLAILSFTVFTDAHGGIATAVVWLAAPCTPCPPW